MQSCDTCELQRSERRMQAIVRLYAVNVFFATVVSIAALTWRDWPWYLSDQPVVEVRIVAIAVGYDVLAAITGIFLIVHCLCRGVEPQDLLSHCTLIAIVMCVLTVLFLPGIQG